MNHILLISVLAFSFSSCFNSPSNSELLEPTKKESKMDTQMARIKTIHGDIVFKFRSDKAPTTVERIKELITSDFYNGLTFHRVVPDFVIQGGDPLGNGTGGSGKNIMAEFNDLKHVPGMVAMARSQNINSADSQFYITLGTFPHLDGQYTIFGEVTEGMEVAKKIQPGDKMLTVTLE